MTTSQTMSLKSVVFPDGQTISPAQIAYMNARSKDRAHELVLKLFIELSKADGITRSYLARRLGKKPEQITRWLGAPGNWTLDTLSSLLAAMGYEVEFSLRKLSEIPAGNHHHILASQLQMRNLPEMKAGARNNATEFELNNSPGFLGKNKYYDSGSFLESASQMGGE